MPTPDPDFHHIRIGIERQNAKFALVKFIHDDGDPKNFKGIFLRATNASFRNTDAKFQVMITYFGGPFLAEFGRFLEF